MMEIIHFWTSLSYKIFVKGFALAVICPWLAFFPERLPSDKTDASKIAKDSENEVEPQTAKDWIKELVSTRHGENTINLFN